MAEEHGSQSQEPISIHELLAHWFNTAQDVRAMQQARGELPKCPTCGYTVQTFLDRGKFGCPDCYDTFRDQLPRVFRRLQNGGTRHAGKAPDAFVATMALQRDYEQLRQALQRAIAEERFEEAADLRDRSRAIERRLKESGAGEGDDGDGHR